LLNAASEVTYIVSGVALNSTHSLTLNTIIIIIIQDICVNSNVQPHARMHKQEKEQKLTLPSKAYFMS